jgi:hypothetical protein
MSLHRILWAAPIGASLALFCANADAQTAVGAGTPIGSSVVIGAPGTVYGPAVANLGSPGLATLPLGATAMPMSIGYASIPSTIGTPNNTVGGSATQWPGLGSLGAGGTTPATAGTGATSGVGPLGGMGPVGATIDGYGTGLTTTGYAPAPGVNAGASPIGANASMPGLGYGSTMGGVYVGQINGVPGLFP